MEEFSTPGQNILERVASMAEFANGVASLVCGHLKILREGGFSFELSEMMAAALHAQLLGLNHHHEEEQGEFVEYYAGEEGEEEE